MTESQLVVGESFPLTRTEADSVIQQTLLGMEPVQLSPGRIYGIRTVDGFKLIDLSTEQALRAAGYDRKRPQSCYAFHTIDCFVEYVDRMFARIGEDGKPLPDADDGAYWARRNHALCIADEEKMTIRLIFDAQPNQWGEVYADLRLKHSSEFQSWCAASGRFYMAQQDFAEFCELNLQSFKSPDAATILEIAQTFQAKTTVDFGSAVRLTNGSIKLKREEKVLASAGERSDITIPEKLCLALPIFKYGKTYEVHARLRYRIKDSTVQLSVLLIEPEMALEHAFKQVADEVRDSLDMPVFYGKI